MKETFENFKFLWKYAKGQKKRLIGYFICQIIVVIISIIVPVLSAKIIINLTSNLYYQLAILVCVIFMIENLRNVVNYFQGLYNQHIFRSILIEMQTNVALEILKLQNKVLDKKGSGLFIQRITGDSSNISEALIKYTNIIRELITNVGVFIAILIINRIVFVYVLITVLIRYLIEKTKTKDINELDKIVRKKQEAATGFIGETIRGARDIKMLNAENNFMKRMKKLIKDVNESKYNMSETRRKYIIINGFTVDLFNMLFILLMIYLITQLGLEVSLALVLYNYKGQVSYFAYSIEDLISYSQSFNLSCQRIKDIFASEEFAKETFGNNKIKKIKGNFEFKNVSFSYNDKQVLKNINFKVNANETVAFVGKSGVGKTTIFNLLCKMYDNYKGLITIDNKDIKTLDKDSIRGNITIISQDPYIFNLSIKDNLKLVKSNLTEKEMKRACKLACLDEFIENLPEKYNTMIGEGGVNLSGGQKQRLAIARAFIQNTEIILMDEATSALDNETQKSIAKAINNMQSKYTILIIAHRLSTIKEANRILYIENGKVKMEGTHAYLLKNCAGYKKLYEAEIEK